ncbi:MAG TPA: uracil-DNA glycosylase [Gemmatimonadaceae bacterium]|nr:uracil-DNA glycosylase [Gemmatimonadaceae bacterium]
MNARDRLRRYLEQRREMGERELVLDDLSVEEVMRLVGALRSRPTDRELPRSTPVRETAAPAPRGAAPGDADGDWRATLLAAGSTPAPAPAPTRPRGGRAFPPPGVDDVPSAPAGHPVDGSATPVPPVPASIVVGTGARELFGGPIGQIPTLDELRDAIASCNRCPLFETARNAVPGEGSATAELVCVGEAPGAVEDETGKPFVGPAGQLLTKILGAIALKREDVYICNVLKHRPPLNRNPFPKEVEACSPYLVRQLELIRPKAILALGTFAAQTLLQSKLPIGKLRGAVHRYHGVPLVVTYHPAALLRNPAWKRPTWEDVQLVRRILDSASRAP